MKVLGITGGVGSGKSQVLAYLEEEYGAVVCRMDDVARQLQKKGTDCFRKIVEAFGEEIVGPDGELDRGRLSQIVFRDAEKREQLNQIVHPQVLCAVRLQIEQAREDKRQLYVVEAALLPRAGKELCDEVWYIYTDDDVRRERLKQSRNYTDEKITEMIASQPDEREFRSVSRAVIQNSGSFEETKREIDRRMDGQ